MARRASSYAAVARRDRNPAPRCTLEYHGRNAVDPLGHPGQGLGGGGLIELHGHALDPVDTRDRQPRPDRDGQRGTGIPAARRVTVGVTSGGRIHAFTLRPATCRHGAPRVGGTIHRHGRRRRRPGSR